MGECWWSSFVTRMKTCAQLWRRFSTYTTPSMRILLQLSPQPGYSSSNPQPEGDAMPYGSFEQNKKIKALGMAMTALDQAVRDVRSEQVVIQPKMLERYGRTLDFLERSRTGAKYSANELASLERRVQANRV